MSKSINFVQERRKNLSLAEQEDQVLLQKMIRGFIAVAAVALLVIGTQFYLNYQLNRVVEDQKIARAGILQQESVEREFSIFSHKLTNITDLWGKRQNKQDAVVFFIKLFSGDTVVSGLNYSAETEALTFHLRTNSIFVLENALNTLTSGSVVEKFPSISKRSLSRRDDASYSLEVTVALGNLESTE